MIAPSPTGPRPPRRRLRADRRRELRWLPATAGYAFGFGVAALACAVTPNLCLSNLRRLMRADLREWLHPLAPAPRSPAEVPDGRT